MLGKKNTNKKHISFVEGLVHILIKQGNFSESEGRVIIKSFYDTDAYDFDSFLVNEGLVTVARMLNALEEYYKVPSFDAVGYFFDNQLLHKFPKHVMLQYGFIPLEDDGNIMIVVASDPADSDLLFEIGKYVSYDIQFRVGLHHDILDAVKEFYDNSLTQYNEQDESSLDEANFELLNEDDEDKDTIDFS